MNIFIGENNLKDYVFLKSIIEKWGIERQQEIYFHWYKQLQKFGIDYDEMYRKMHEAYAEAAEKNHTLLADVGSAFYEKTETENLFNDDGSHPNEAGSNLAAETIAEVILKDANA